MIPLNNQKNNWCFTLGRHPQLSAAEIAAVFSMKKFVWRPPYLILEDAALLEPTNFIKQLGGTIKIGEEVGGKGESRDKIIAYLKKTFPAGKINFSVGGDLQLRDGLKIKSALTRSGRSARFIEPKNTATIIHNRLLDKGADFTAIDGRVFVSRAVQPIEEWGERDYGRPARDDESGMLPPKLALLMINLASVSKDTVILDPFCGSGTIISEALISDYKHIFGGDISDKAVADSKKNIDWLKQSLSAPISAEIKIEKMDAAELSKFFKAGSIGAIIAEPYLGRPLRGKETKQQLIEQAAELKKSYLTAFVQFQKILQPGGAVIFIIPRFQYGREWITVDCQSEIEKIGFAVSPLLDFPELFAEYLLYHRPGQFIGREIWRFKKI